MICKIGFYASSVAQFVETGKKILGKFLEDVYKRQGRESGQEDGDLVDELAVENRERYDYKEFLRKFAVLKDCLLYTS